MFSISLSVWGPFQWFDMHFKKDAFTYLKIAPRGDGNPIFIVTSSLTGLCRALTFVLIDHIFAAMVCH